MTAPDGYLRAILADGARPVRHRGGVRELLGVVPDAGVRVSFPSIPRGVGFVYRRQSDEYAPTRPAVSPWQVEEVDDPFGSDGPDRTWPQLRGPDPVAFSGTHTESSTMHSQAGSSVTAEPQPPARRAGDEPPPSESAPAPPPGTLSGPVIAVPGITTRPNPPASPAPSRSGPVVAEPETIADGGPAAPRSEPGARRSGHGTAVAEPGARRSGPGEVGPGPGGADAPGAYRAVEEARRDGPAGPQRPGPAASFSAAAVPTRPAPARPALARPGPAGTAEYPDAVPVTGARPGVSGSVPRAAAMTRAAAPGAVPPRASSATEPLPRPPGRRTAPPAPPADWPAPGEQPVPSAPIPPPPPPVVVAAEPPPGTVGPAAFWERRHVGRLRARNLR